MLLILVNISLLLFNHNLFSCTLWSFLYYNILDINHLFLVCITDIAPTKDDYDDDLPIFETDDAAGGITTGDTRWVTSLDAHWPGEITSLDAHWPGEITSLDAHWWWWSRWVTSLDAHCWWWSRWDYLFWCTLMMMELVNIFNWINMWSLSYHK